jgi:Na+-translocating ferredoxin:NAD+ oxidoreductase RnfC subunit
MADVPHFALPFRIDNGRAVVNDQDTSAIATAIQRWEPRADTLLGIAGDALDELAFTVSAFIGTRSAD